MAKFNTPVSHTQRITKREDATTNYEGGLAFSADPKLELYLRVCTCLLEDTYYEKAPDRLQAIRSLIRQCPRDYVVKLADYARNEMYLRSIPLVLLAEATRMGEPGEPKPEIRWYTPRIVRRVDEVTEILAYWINKLGGGSARKFPMALRKGLADAMRGFDEYQYGKYDRDGQITLRDALRLVRPKPTTAEMSDLFRRIKTGELKSPDTWEVYISTHGSSRETWNHIAPKMPFMAVLRNLRNFEKYNAEAGFARAEELFNNPEIVKRSKQLPWRFYTAWKNISSPRLKDAVISALDHSVDAMDGWDVPTAILVDTSGSMTQNRISKHPETQNRISRHPDVTCADVAALLASMFLRMCKGQYWIGNFDSKFTWIGSVSKHDSVMTNAERIRDMCHGDATFANLAIEAMRRDKIKADRVILLSDMQCYTPGDRLSRDEIQWLRRWHPNHEASRSLAEEWELYKREVNPNAILFSVDLQGYGTLQFPNDDKSVFTVAGFSDRMMEIVDKYNDRFSIVEMINNRPGYVDITSDWC